LFFQESKEKMAGLIENISTVCPSFLRPRLARHLKAIIDGLEEEEEETLFNSPSLC
jgi:hypothetical protein